MTSSCGKRPCSICRKWFRPDPRIGERQKVCSSPECQRRRRARTQASWRRGNPSYFIARRIDKRNSGGRDAEPLRVPAPLDRLPWDLPQDEMGGKASDFIGVLSRLILVHVQDVMRHQVHESITESGRVLGVPEKTRDEPCEGARRNGA